MDNSMVGLLQRSIEKETAGKPGVLDLATKAVDVCRIHGVSPISIDVRRWSERVLVGVDGETFRNLFAGRQVLRQSNHNGVFWSGTLDGVTFLWSHDAHTETEEETVTL